MSHVPDAEERSAGTSVVDKVARIRAGTRITVSSADRQPEHLVVAARPDRAAARRYASGRPLSVFLYQTRGQFSCVLLAASHGGPIRLPIPIAAALALCEEGVRTLVLAGGDEHERKST